MTDQRHALGLAAEAAAARWLASAGWRLIEQRRRTTGGGEVDLVAIDREGVLVAIEVRARRSRRAGDPTLSIDARRVARLRRSLVEIAMAAAPVHRGLRVDLVTAEPVMDQPGAWRLVRTAGIG